MAQPVGMHTGPVVAGVVGIDVQPRGPIKVKSRGAVQMYFALRLKPEISAAAKGG